MAAREATMAALARSGSDDELEVVVEGRAVEVSRDEEAAFVDEEAWLADGAGAPVAVDETDSIFDVARVVAVESVEAGSVNATAELIAAKMVESWYAEVVV